jgi:hypothetical protein
VKHELGSIYVDVAVTQFILGPNFGNCWPRRIPLRLQNQHLRLDFLHAINPIVRPTHLLIVFGYDCFVSSSFNSKASCI